MRKSRVSWQYTKDLKVIAQDCEQVFISNKQLIICIDSDSVPRVVNLSEIKKLIFYPAVSRKQFHSPAEDIS